MSHRNLALLVLTVSLTAALALAAEDPYARLGEAMASELAAKWSAPKRKLAVVPISVQSIAGEDKIAGKRLADLVVAALQKKGFAAEFRADAAGVISDAKQDVRKSGKAAKTPLVVLVYGQVTVTGEPSKPIYRWRLAAVVPDTSEILVEARGELGPDPRDLMFMDFDGGR
jgi:hypothetical protein